MAVNWCDSSLGVRIVDFSSEIEGCEAEYLLDPRLDKIWLSQKGMPQWLSFYFGDIANSKDIIIRTIGWHCWHSYVTNPKSVTLHVSSDGSKFKYWDTFQAVPGSGTQLFCCAPISISLYPHIVLEFTETFGGIQVYLNRLFFYSEEIPTSPISTPSILFKTSNTSMIAPELKSSDENAGMFKENSAIEENLHLDDSLALDNVALQLSTRSPSPFYQTHEDHSSSKRKHDHQNEVLDGKTVDLDENFDLVGALHTSSLHSLRSSSQSSQLTPTQSSPLTESLTSLPESDSITCDPVDRNYIENSALDVDPTDSLIQIRHPCTDPGVPLHPSNIDHHEDNKTSKLIEPVDKKGLPIPVPSSLPSSILTVTSSNASTHRKDLSTCDNVNQKREKPEKKNLDFNQSLELNTDPLIDINPANIASSRVEIEALRSKFLGRHGIEIEDSKIDFHHNVKRLDITVDKNFKEGGFKLDSSIDIVNAVPPPLYSAVRAPYSQFSNHSPEIDIYSRHPDMKTTVIDSQFKSTKRANHDKLKSVPSSSKSSTSSSSKGRQETTTLLQEILYRQLVELEEVVDSNSNDDNNNEAVCDDYEYISSDMRCLAIELSDRMLEQQVLQYQLQEIRAMKQLIFTKAQEVLGGKAIPIPTSSSNSRRSSSKAASTWT